MSGQHKTNGYPEWMVRAIIKAGGSVTRYPSEVDPQLARLSVMLAEQRCEAAKARATIRALLETKKP